MKQYLDNFELFENRHNNSEKAQIEEMLKVIEADSVDSLINETIPEAIRLTKPLDLPEAKTEFQYLKEMQAKASKNKVFRSYIGMGYYNCFVPGVIQRNILENPSWYTAYTPYQTEIAQGRLEMLLNFQTMISDLTGFELSNASLLDEGTAAAEAMIMFKVARKKDKKKCNVFFVSKYCHPQTIDVVRTRAESFGLALEVGDEDKIDLSNPDYFGVLLQYPNTDGEVVDYTDFISTAHDNNVKVVMAADLLALTLLKEPSKMGADIAVGTSQRFGVPMGFGGPHAAYIATHNEYKRLMPGRIIGVSKDVDGNEAYRMALQTREQHIKREKATSNICTSQVLLAVMAAAYAIYHGAEGIRAIANRIHAMATLLDASLQELGLEVVTKQYFETLKVNVISGSNKKKIKELSERKSINFRYFEDNYIGIALNETTSIQSVKDIISVITEVLGKSIDINSLINTLSSGISSSLKRETEYLTHPVFKNYHSEHEMLRYLKRLEDKDLSLVHSMISLGSCTMKLNATSEMIPISWANMANIHPFAPVDQTLGYKEIIDELEKWLCVITGFYAVSFQPNSGAQGEYAGLMAIRAYHQSRGDHHRNITIIPSSAHGTNPASAIMAGMKVIITKCDHHGNIDIEDLKEKAEQYKNELSSLMVTYPSTHGVFEEGIIEICQIIHDNGGKVYMDGANMNAQVGLTNPSMIGADVCHLNLHKTFSIPHGGGGPGMGPIAVTKDLAPFLSGHVVVETGGKQAITAVSSAPYGSASILAISYGYIALLGKKGVTNATKMAILNANYLNKRIGTHYSLLYTGKNGRSAHEMIVDCRAFKKVGIEVVDIAKRLMDYGFHAPTVSFPVAGTLMIEPTESENKPELDRFCEAMIAIRKEIAEIEVGETDLIENVLKNAPHTAKIVMSDQWEKPYSREKAAYPINYLKENKFWPSVRRIDDAFGDRNLICTCIPVKEFMEKEVEA